MCTSAMPGFWVKLLWCFSLGEYSSGIPHYTSLVQSWAKLQVVGLFFLKKKKDWRSLGSQSAISLDNAVSMFVLYIQILWIQNCFLVTLGLNFESFRFLSFF